MPPACLEPLFCEESNGMGNAGHVERAAEGLGSSLKASGYLLYGEY